MAANWINCALASTLLIILVSAPLGSAIKCYQCQSRTDPACANDLPKTAPDGNHWANKYIVDCSARPNKTHLDPQFMSNESTFCRKQHQEVEGMVNVVRSCGFVRSDKACYSTANPPTKTYVCQCDSADLCNSALGHFRSSTAGFLLAALACLTYYVRF